MSDIFISYSRKDKPWVEKLASLLEAEGYDVWWDPEILPGQDFETVIRLALEGAKCVITVWSQSSISSHWVKEESSYALERKVLVPVLYQAIKPPMPFGRIHSADLQGWKGKTSDPRYQQLLRAISVHCPVDKVEPPLYQSSTTKTKKPWLGIASGLLLLGVAGYLGSSYLLNNGNREDQNKQVVVKNSTSSPQERHSGQYIDNGDGTVTDTQTKLMWKKCSEGQFGIKCAQGEAYTYSLEEVVSQFKNVEFAGYKNWRVPTKEELLSLVYCSNGVSQQEASKESCNGEKNDQGKYDRPTIDLSTFPKTEISYWSSSLYVGSHAHLWYVSFRSGYADSRSSYGYVRLVRSEK